MRTAREATIYTTLYSVCRCADLEHDNTFQVVAFLRL